MQAQRTVNVLLALLTVSLGGCGGATAPAAAVVGRYELRTVNGAPLPFIVAQSDTTKGELTDDQLTLNADGTFHDLEALRTTRGGSVTLWKAAYLGIYESTDASVQFTVTSPVGGGFAGAVSGTTLTITYPSGNTFVYSR